MKIIIIILIILSLTITTILSIQIDEKDFYKLLNVPRDADKRAIRKAFKLLAVKYHPDKNTDDKDAQGNFILITKAYETLIDPDARKHFDLYGYEKESNTKQKQTFHSYSYYQNVFGIYDDDPLIITLGLSDFENNVNDANLVWFVNFYSPQCRHCHDLASTWRQLATELEGVVRIAAVNCEEDWQLCTQLQIRGYPTLMFFNKEAHMFEGEKYMGERTVDSLQNFVLDRLDLQIETITTSEWNRNDLKQKQWLLFLCGNLDGLCPEEETIIKLTAMLDGLVSVARINEPELCAEISSGYLDHPIVFWKVRDLDTSNNDVNNETVVSLHELSGSDCHELAKQVLALLPEPQMLDQEAFQDVRTRLNLGDSNPWLICFTLGTATELNVQLKKLPAFLPNTNIGVIHCARSVNLCTSLHISRYPVWAVLKEGGAFEMHHGKDSLHDIVAFARDSSQATNLHALSPADFNNLLKDGNAWFIDWYAPWCPPCQRFMPELRRASQHFTPDSIKFGTIDCTLHSVLCSQQNIRSYPTIILYNNSKVVQYFHGRLDERSIVDLVDDMLNPIVISLNSDTFKSRLVRKPIDELWIVDFYAPWCGPCQKLVTQWRTLAKEVVDLEHVFVAQVDCTAEPDLCSSQQVRSYPTIRLYPFGNQGLNTVAMYNGHREASAIKHWLLGFLPSPVLELNAKEFEEEVLNIKDTPWLIDFYAPWCGHCHQFAPEFTTVAQRLEGVVRTGKMNCEQYKYLCQQQHVHSYPTVMLYISSTLRYEIDSQYAQFIIDRVKSLLTRLKTRIRDEF